MTSQGASAPKTITVKVYTPLPEPENIRFIESVEANKSLSELKASISDQLAQKPAPSQIALFHSGHRLQDDGATMQEVFGANAFQQGGTYAVHMLLRDSSQFTSRQSTPAGGRTNANGQPIGPPPQPFFVGHPQPGSFQAGHGPMPPNLASSVAGMPPGAMNGVAHPPQGTYPTQQIPFNNWQGPGQNSSATGSFLQQPQMPGLFGNPNQMMAMHAQQLQQAQQLAMQQMQARQMQQVNAQQSNQPQNTGWSHSNPNPSTSSSDEQTSSDPTAHSTQPQGPNGQPPFAMPSNMNVRAGVGPNGERIMMMTGTGPVPPAFPGRHMHPFPNQQMPPQSTAMPSQAPPSGAEQQRQQPLQTVAWVLNSPSGPTALLFSPDGVFRSSNPPRHQPTTNAFTSTLSSTTTTPSIHPGLERLRRARSTLDSLNDDLSEMQQSLNNISTGLHASNGNRAAPGPSNAGAIPAQPPEQQGHEQHQQQQPAQQQDPNAVQDINTDVLAILTTLFRHVWLLVRVFGLIWLLTRGASSRRTFLILLCTAVYLLGQAGVFGDRPLERVRARFERIMGAADPAPANANANANADADANAAPVQNEGGQNGAAARPDGGRAPRVIEPGAGRARQQQEGGAGAVGRASGWERALTLFLASLYPGVGERQVAARERIEREAREVEERRRRDEEERAAAAAEGAVARVEGEGEGRASGVDPQPQGEVRERRVEGASA